MTSLDETRAFIPLKIAVLTISDTRQLADDQSGDILVERRDMLAMSSRSAIVTGDIEAIRAKVVAGIFCDPNGPLWRAKRPSNSSI